MRVKTSVSLYALPSLLALCFAPLVRAESGILYTNSVTYCAEAKAVLVDSFDIAYHQSNSSVTFSFSLASVEEDLNVNANLYINAYGRQIINETLQLCDLLSGAICPLPQVNFTGTSLGLCAMALFTLGDVEANTIQGMGRIRSPRSTPKTSRASRTRFPTSKRTPGSN
jgi:hypothetical protein